MQYPQLSLLLEAGGILACNRHLTASHRVPAVANYFLTGEIMQKEKTHATAIELKGITKTFGSVVANNQIDLSVRKGEILALLGENGSGKTTLMNMLSGIYRPDSGSVLLNGEAVTINSPEDAIEFGIGMIHQHFKLVDVLSATDNIMLGVKGGSRWLKKTRSDKIQEISRHFGLDISPEKKIYQMSVGEKQTVEILKVMYRNANILILDEPTAVLTPQETKKLFDILRRMKAEGCAIIIITHKLNEVMEISDRVTILRKGESIATVETAETNAHELTELMVGRPVELSIDRPENGFEETLLEVHHLTVANEEGFEAIQDIKFELKRGEILGVAGIAGSGQKELCEAMAGLLPVSKGAILYNKENIIGKSPEEIIKMGISMSFIPEDRLGMGLAASMGMVDNMMLKTYKKNKGPFVSRKEARELSKRLIKQLGIVTPGVDTPVRRLSGGNVQKVLLGREIESNPNVLITAYAVRGLDINSSYTIYDSLNEQKQKGVGILFIGEDLDVMLELCDRIMVLCHGKVTGIVEAKTSTKEEIGLLMTGGSGKEGSADA
ncbi:simple sugar transport system ATP-binding protein [Anaerobium acetethylicum]|uniref:Simple sugar transport system ATP-binding protein n=2 Tax=Anaerobium acetethylicum TaxID=1619234 RepID=A0A1D3TNL6_9FIRM|nr:simple sugar transport system ATP-binding protein [Anaerobium acetethylicum]